MLYLLITITFFKVTHSQLQQWEDASLSKVIIDRLKSVILTEIERDPGTRVMGKEEFSEGWCLEKKINITLSHPKCTDRIIETNYCWGQCNSLYIPGKVMFRTCTQCRAKTMKTKMFALDCLGTKNNKKVRYVAQEIILSCECLECESEDRPQSTFFNSQSSDEN